MRQRLVYALSQIFVISMQDSSVADNPRAVAAWLDMLGDKGLGNYRDLLEAVSRHPMMGMYLSHLRNQKADARTGRVPDENYAREVMQLFSIGLVELNADGSVRSSGGKPLETYAAADIAGLAKVFTGWSWDCPDMARQQLLLRRLGERQLRPGPQLQEHARLPAVPLASRRRSFLGTTIAAQTHGRPAGQPEGRARRAGGAPERRALHRPQLIQRLVTSNPSPQYVAAVGAAFKRQRRRHEGHAEGGADAPRGARAMSATDGKLREPVLKLSAFLRAFGFTLRQRQLPRRQHRQRRHRARPDADALALGVQLLPSRLRAAGHRGGQPRRWPCRRCRSRTRPPPPAT